MIKIDEKYYAIDIDAMMEWIATTPSSEKNVSTVTTLTYPISDGDNELVEKEVSENKTTLNDTMNNIRYDLMRNLIDTLTSNINNIMDNEMPSFSLNDLTFGQKLVFNTLYAKNIIVEITPTDL